MDTNSGRDCGKAFEAASVDVELAAADSEHRLKSGDEVVDEISKLMERYDQRLTLDNLRLADRYIKGELKILVRFRTSGETDQFVAYLQSGQSRGIEWPHRDLSDPLFNKGVDQVALQSLPFKIPSYLPSRALAEIERGTDRNNGDEEAMLVGIVKFVEYPELMSFPTLVWFDRVDRVDGILPHSLYFSTTLGFVFRGTRGNGEISLAELGVAATSGSGEKERVSEMVESASEVVDCVSRQACDPRGDGFDSLHVKGQISRLRITLGPDFIRIGVKEGSLCAMEILDVLFGPFDF